MNKEKKKFRDTKVGGWLAKNAPKALEVVGDVLPDKGVLGIVKNLIDKDETMSAQQKNEFQVLALEYELELVREETKQIQSHHNVETTQLEQDDLFTKRARPTRQYVWLLIIVAMIVLDFSSFRNSGTLIFLNFENPLLYVIAADFGIYSLGRTAEKRAKILKG